MLFASCVDHLLLLIVCVQTSGWTAIFFAAKAGNLEITDLLIKGGAKLDIKDKVDTTRLSTNLASIILYLSLCS